MMTHFQVPAWMWRQSVSMARNKLWTRANLRKLSAQVRKKFKNHHWKKIIQKIIQTRHFRLGQTVQHHAKIDQFQNVTDGAAMEALSMKIVLHLLQNVVSISFYVPILTFYYVMIITLSRELHIRLYDLVIDWHILDCNIWFGIRPH